MTTSIRIEPVTEHGSLVAVLVDQEEEADLVTFTCRDIRAGTTGDGSAFLRLTLTVTTTVEPAHRDEHGVTYVEPNVDLLSAWHRERLDRLLAVRIPAPASAAVIPWADELLTIARLIGETLPPTPSMDPDDDDSWLEAYGVPVALPTVVRPEVWHGPIGEWAHGLAGTTPTDPFALLVTGLSMFGAECGRAAYRPWFGIPTYPTVFALFVGETTAGKGNSLTVCRQWHDLLDGAPARVITDIASGEGLIRHLVKMPVSTDGTPDTRAFVELTEFSQLLTAKRREGATIGQVLRRTYDGDRQERTVVGAPTGEAVEMPSVGLVAHVTPDELLMDLPVSDMANGFLNRFLVLPLHAPDGLRQALTHEAAHQALAERLSKAVLRARSHRAPVLTTPEAQAMLDHLDAWQAESTRRPGIVGRMTARIRQNVGRAALAYSLSRMAGEGTPRVEVPDVLAALVIGEAAELTMLAQWAGRRADPEEARMIARVSRAGADGISPSGLTKELYYAGNRFRGRALLARLVGQHALQLQGHRLVVGPASMTTSTLWRDVVRTAQPSTPERGPSTPERDTLHPSALLHQPSTPEREPSTLGVEGVEALSVGVEGSPTVTRSGTTAFDPESATDDDAEGESVSPPDQGPTDGPGVSGTRTAPSGTAVPSEGIGEAMPSQVTDRDGRVWDRPCDGDLEHWPDHPSKLLVGDECGACEGRVVAVAKVTT